MPHTSPLFSVIAPALILTAAALHPLFAQSPSFEVASIRRNNSVSGTSTERATRGRFIATNATIAELIQFAFGIRDFQVSGGPGWIRDERYDVVATTGTEIDLTDKLLEPYLRSLLADRARFRYHSESKEMQLYSLTVSKSGPKIRAHTGEEEPSTHEVSHGPGKTGMTAINSTMADLARILNRELNRTVVDNTGLKGGYDLTLEWAPNPSSDSADASLFTALQEQLGLKLESTKGPVEIIVIDSIERPSEN